MRDFSDRVSDMAPIWFPFLNQLGFKDCAFNNLWDNQHNLNLDLGSLRLYKLSVDITSMMMRFKAVNKLTIQVVNNA